MNRGWNALSAAWHIRRDNRNKPEITLTRQWARLSNMISFARTKSSFYAKLYEGLPPNVSDTTLLPIVTKPQLMTSFDGWVTDPAVTKTGVDTFISDERNIGRLYLGRYAVWKTSGTTGEPGIFVHDIDAMDVYATVALVRYYADWLTAGRFWDIVSHKGLAAVVVATGGYFSAAAVFELVRKRYPWLRNRVRLFSATLPLPEVVAGLNDFQPAIIVGYPTVIFALAYEQLAGRLNIDPVLAITVGEWLSPDDRNLMAEVFKCTAWDTYGASEFPYIASSCKNGWLHLSADWVILEPVNGDYAPVLPGEPSHTVLLTNLANKVQPIIRYDLGDSVTVNPDPCACGCSMPAIRIEGRRDDVLQFKTPDEDVVRILPLAIASVVEEVPGVQSFQLIQTTPVALSVRLETASSAADIFVWRSVARRLKDFLAKQGLAAVKIIRDAQPVIREPISGKFRQVWTKAKDNL